MTVLFSSSPEQILEVIDSIEPIAAQEEAIFSINDEEIQVNVIDEAAIANVNLTIGREYFDTYDVSNTEVGIPLDSLKTLINSIKSDPEVGEEDQEIFIEINIEDQTLSVWGNPGTIQSEISLIQTSAISRPPEIPQIDHESELSVSVEYLYYVADELGSFGDHIQVSVNENGAVNFDVDSDLRSHGAKLQPSSNNLYKSTNNASESISSIFNTEYLSNVVNSISFEDQEIAQVYIGDELPAEFHVEAYNGIVTVKSLIAPRIKDESNETDNEESNTKQAEQPTSSA